MWARSPAGGIEDGEGNRQMEDACGEQTQRLMESENAVDVMEALEWLCRERGAELRQEAATQLHRAVRHMRLRAEADALEGEAASWCLLRHLYVAGPVAHGGPELAGVGTALTLRQRAAKMVVEDPEMDVMARVVAWLEFLAGQTIDNEEAASGSAYKGRFAAKEAVWQETKNKLGRNLDTSALVTELDPDAPSRQWRHLDGDNAKMQEELMATCWRLVRAGRIKDAMRVCMECGEPYRTASWSGISLSGLVSAFPATTEYTREEQVLALATEEEMGMGTMHALSRWACLQAAEQMAEAVNKTGGGCGGSVYESAVYAAQCGFTPCMLKACKSWTDFCWAYFRSCLDVSLDRALSQQCPQPPAAWREVNSDGKQMLGKHTAKAGSEPAALATGQVGAILDGQWPLEKVVRAAPRDISDCLARLQGLLAPGSDAIHTSVQTFLIAAAASQIAGSPHGDLIAFLQAQVQQCMRQLMLRGADGSALPAGEPTASDRHLVRFSAHLALVLEHLDAYELGTDAMEDMFGPQSNARNFLLECFIMQLVEAAQHKLVPLYSCKLRPGRRETVYSVYLESVADGNDSDICETVFEISRDCFRKHGVEGQEGQDEMHRLAISLAEATRISLEGGHARRVSSVRWLAYSSETLGAALNHINAVSHSLLLGCGPQLAGGLAQRLLSDMLPDSLRGQELEAREIEAQARLDAGTAGDGPTPNDFSELVCWQQFFQAEARAQDWETSFGQLLQGEESVVDKSQAASSAAEIVTALSEVVEQGWMREGMSWDAEHVTEEAVYLRLVPSAMVPLTENDFQAMPSEMAEQLANELRLLWDQELAPWLSQQLGDSVLWSMEATLESVSGDSGHAVVLMAIESRSTQPELSLSNPAVLNVTAKLLANILKGQATSNTSSDLHGLPLLALSCEASQPVACALARYMAIPRLVLRAARLRAVASKLNKSEAGLPHLPSLVADPKLAISVFFSPVELQDLLEFERRVAVATS